jgi:hypothetical protein
MPHTRRDDLPFPRNVLTVGCLRLPDKGDPGRGSYSFHTHVDHGNTVGQIAKGNLAISDSC